MAGEGGAGGRFTRSKSGCSLFFFAINLDFRDVSLALPKLLYLLLNCQMILVFCCFFHVKFNVGNCCIFKMKFNVLNCS
jgi:hypothetical protein